MNQTEAKRRIAELVEKYDQVKKSGRIKTYTEAETCKEFILPLFNALGWDTESKDEVSAEEHTSSKDRSDYGFYLNKWPKFYLEAKKLSADLHDEKFAKQATTYSWNKGIDWAILTDFESLIVFSAQDISEHLSHRRFFEIKYSDYLDNFDQLYWLSKESFQKNILDKEAEKVGKKLQKVSVTEALYKDLNNCREILLRSFNTWNKDIPNDLLEEGVQKMLDRLIFIRVAEDRKLENPTLLPLLRKFGSSSSKEFFDELVSNFRRLNGIYNSNLFFKHAFEDWQEYSGATGEVIKILHGKQGYYEYDFKAIPADILGSVYENYLGYQLSQSLEGVEVSKNARKRKEQGIYYTPTYIVDYIVSNALKPVLDKCNTVEEIKAIKVLDPSCGSGSFLLAALELIYKKYLEFGAKPGEMTKITILLDNIFGVDLDEQAVEIARLNLLISALDSQMKLPDLSRNIKNGNSLISSTDTELEKAFGENYREKKSFNWQEEFPQVFDRTNPGFNVIVGNPPYVNTELLSPSDKAYYGEKYETYYKRYDLYGLFFEKALHILEKEGIVAFIVPAQIFNNLSFKKLRLLILKNKWLKEVLYLGDKVFKDANNDVCVIFLKKPTVESIKLINAINFNSQASEIVKHDYFDKFEGVMSISAGIESDSILNKIFNPAFHRLDTHFKVFQGIVTGNNEAFMPNGVTITSEKIENELIHPVLHGRDFERWRIRNSNRKILYVYPQTNIDKYPMTKKWLEGFREQLEKRREVVNEVIPWYSLQWPRDKDLLDKKPKIVIQATRNPRLKKRLVATIEDKGAYGTQGLNFVIAKNDQDSLYFLLGVLNSSTWNFLYATKFLNVAIKAEYLKSTPLPMEDKNEKEKISKLAKTMLKLHEELGVTAENSNKWHSIKSEAERTEQQIDNLVYQLYGFTDQETSLIEKRQ